MPPTCPECNGSTLWDDSVGSAVCTSCGTLTDPSQSVLTSQYDFSQGANAYRESWDPDFAVIAKRSHPTSTWALSDQSKEVRDRRNSLAIFEFIKCLARSLNASGLSPRAMALFHQARAAMQFRWGRKAKLVAGACLSIAMRESNRPDCLRDIAHLLDEPLSPLSRTYLSIIQVLGLVLSHVESSSYIPTLQNYLSSLLQGQPTAFPDALTQELNTVSLHSASNTADSLGRLLARIGSPSVVHYAAPSIACAIYMLSLESEARHAIKHLGVLAQILGARLQVGKSAVMGCYKAVQDVLASLVDNVPWLDKYEVKKGRARVAKRSVVARAARDIAVFYDDSWKSEKKPVLDIIEESEPQCQDVPETDEGYTSPARKRRNVHHNSRHAMQFLLDPVTGPLPKPTAILPRSRSPDLEAGSNRASTVSKSHYPLLSYFLSTQAAAQRPTRLQLLSAARGGQGEISDSELFEEGELEGLMRSEEEMEIVNRLFDWGHECENVASGEEMQLLPPVQQPSNNQVSQRDAPPPKGKRSRIDLEALAKLLNDEPTTTGLLGTEFGDLSGELEDSGVESAEESGKQGEHRASLPSSGRPDDEIVIEEWRPTSPVGNASLDDWYGEVYE